MILFFVHLSLKVDRCLKKYYTSSIIILLLITVVLTILITFSTSFVYFYPDTEQFAHCKCIRDYQRRIDFVDAINQTCPTLHIRFGCYKYLDSVQIACINTSLWLMIWRAVLNCEALLNVLIAMVIWRSPYVPNLLAFASCSCTILAAYVTGKWWALGAEMVVFIVGYAMLCYGIVNISKLKSS